MGKIADYNTRTLLTMTKEMKAQLEQIAKVENRSFNNLVVTVLQNYLKEKGQ